MIHVFKSGDTYKADGKSYDIKCINEKDKAFYLENGWVSSLEEVKAKRGPKKKVDKDGD